MSRRSGPKKQLTLDLDAETIRCLDYLLSLTPKYADLPHVIEVAVDTLYKEEGLRGSAFDQVALPPRGVSRKRINPAIDKQIDEFIYDLTRTKAEVVAVAVRFLYAKEKNLQEKT